MQNEYDFSKAERGKFFNPDAIHKLPVYLEPEVLDYFADKARNKGVELSTLINELLKKDIDLIEGVK
jgi:macrodomain Ter protein organizer (MatP/YcbG family)